MPTGFGVTIPLMIWFLAQSAFGSEVTADGLGKVKIGMTVQQFNQAVGEVLQIPTEPEERGCFYLEPQRFPHAAFMFYKGFLRRIDVHGPGIVGPGRIKTGDSEEKLLNSFGKRLKVEPHFYDSKEGRYFTVLLTPKRAVRFEVFARRVDTFYVGDAEQVSYVEGCE